MRKIRARSENRKVNDVTEEPLYQYAFSRMINSRNASSRRLDFSREVSSTSRNDEVIPGAEEVSPFWPRRQRFSFFFFSFLLSARTYVHRCKENRKDQCVDVKCVALNSPRGQGKGSTTLPVASVRPRRMLIILMIVSLFGEASPKCLNSRLFIAAFILFHCVLYILRVT